MAQICLSVELSCLFALLCYKVTCSLFRGVKLLFTRLWHIVAYLLLVRGTKLLIRRIACLLCCITLYIFNLKHVFYLFINYLSCPFAESVRLIFSFSFSFSFLPSPIYLLSLLFNRSSFSLLFSSRPSFLILFFLLFILYLSVSFSFFFLSFFSSLLFSYLLLSLSFFFFFSFFLSFFSLLSFIPISLVLFPPDFLPCLICLLLCLFFSISF